MKSRLIRTTAILLALLLCFTACGSQNIRASGEYQFLDGASVPIGYSVAENPEGGYLIHQGENVIGGIQLLDLSEASQSDPYLYQLSDHLIAAAEKITAQTAPADYDHITSTSEYAYAEISFVNPENEFYHYIFQIDSSYCDLWFDRSYITRETELQFIRGLFGDQR